MHVEIDSGQQAMMGQQNRRLVGAVGDGPMMGACSVALQWASFCAQAVFL